MHLARSMLFISFTYLIFIIAYLDTNKNLSTYIYIHVYKLQIHIYKSALQLLG